MLVSELIDALQDMHPAADVVVDFGLNHLSELIDVFLASDDKVHINVIALPLIPK